jgi:ribosome-binding ATPase YchF (GTP1/OBG family)
MSTEEYMEGNFAETNPWVNELRTHINGVRGREPIIFFSADYEEMIQKEVVVPDGKEYPFGVLNQIVREGNRLLDLINFFTVGADEVRAWTVQKGVRNPEAAGVIHTDFEKNFLNANTMKYEAVENLGEKAKKKVGERSVLDEILFKSISFGTGKDYVVEDGDILEFNIKHVKQTKKKK